MGSMDSVQAQSRQAEVTGRLRSKRWAKVKVNYELYLFLLPTVLYFGIFHYVPMYGVQIAFKNFLAVKGIWDSPWVGFQHFERFFNSYQAVAVIKNTVVLGLYDLAVKFPVPIVLALLLNQIVSTRYKKFIQTVTYAPHFISTVVLVGMVYLFLSPRTGLVNRLLGLFGLDSIFFMGEAVYVKSVYVFSGLWQEAGWAMIIYLAALTSINSELHEAAVVDGASKFKRIVHIDLPGIMPTIMILLILNLGNFMSIGFEKIFLLQNPLNVESAEIIQTYVYKVGFLGADFSYSAAIGLFNSVINCFLLVMANYMAKKFSETSLW
ncbi:sugar ABC transporter permease [Paenibacillus thalictri]|uniref:Sugar ABC transporter permease n=2 Tax=Paenibacillus thalictri TaxID=2527873 RepID=A0A4Q9DZY3_9BACL|nr:ABC transporter permease subunit [Paenibacillus thalictri]TBL81508.1 sugar ABC transporter permease [Paenibacillus thalictri]